MRTQPSGLDTPTSLDSGALRQSKRPALVHVLMEHLSTPNRKMATRLQVYVGRTYDARRVRSTKAPPPFPC
ncbi:MAG: Rpn family recombination-promoting nuclease/putative transposase [Myxococcota bacterium]